MQIFSLVAFLLLLGSCNRTNKTSKKTNDNIRDTVTAAAETQPVEATESDDSADDPAIWIHPKDPAKSVIIGTNKKAGLVVYNLKGQQLYFYPAGKVNNCDLRYHYHLNGDTIDVLAASNRSFQSISLFKIHENGMLDTLHARVIKSHMKDEIYGLCMFKSRVTERFYVFVNSKAGEVEQWELYNSNDYVDAKLVRTFALSGQTEGMVADDETGKLYIGEENVGIWKFEAEPNSSTSGIFIVNSSEKNRNIKYDVEGLAIYDSGKGKGYLLASSQGNDSYAVFERQGSNKYLSSFRITDGIVDGTESTDGIDVTAVALPAYPNGIFVVQDGQNYDGKRKKSQNFKIVSWKEIERYFN